MCHVENDWDREVEDSSVTMQGPTCRLTEDEVDKAQKKLKLGKAGGPTGVVAEIMAAGGHLSLK